MPLHVDKQAFVSKGEQDECRYYSHAYAGFTYTFSLGGDELVARSYDDEPGCAHFLRHDRANLFPVPYEDDLFRAAVLHLMRQERFEQISVLGGDSGTYQPIDLAGFR